MRSTSSALTIIAIALVVSSCAANNVETSPESAGESVTTSLGSPQSTSSVPPTTLVPPATPPPPSTTTTTRRPIDDPFVEVDGVRFVYRCAGEGPVAVLVDQGLAGDERTNPPSTDTFMGWWMVVEGVQDDVRICVYNRRGVGGSDNTRQSAAARTTQDQVDDLVSVIEALELPTPLVLVGHSIAGFNIRLLADQHPELLAGAVFVDASHPDQGLLIGGLPSAQPVEYLDIGTSSLIVRGKGDMGDKPIVVITGGLTWTGEERDTWTALHTDHATLSTNSQHIILDDVGHDIMGGSPETIIEAIRWILEQLQP